MSDHRSHEGPHRGGAGKGGWGKPGDELNAPKEGDDAEPEPEPEEPDNEISIEDFEAAKAAKKAALNAAMAKGATAKEVDSSAFASITLAAKSEDVNEFSSTAPVPRLSASASARPRRPPSSSSASSPHPPLPPRTAPPVMRGGRGRSRRQVARCWPRRSAQPRPRRPRRATAPLAAVAAAPASTSRSRASAFPTLGK